MLRLAVVPLAVYVGVGLALLHARLIWRVLDGPIGLPELASAPQATMLFDRRGRPAFSLHDEARIDIRLDEMSADLVRAVLAVEDHRFYSHRGLDPIRIAGAGWANLRAGRIVEGGSTITQQLVRRLALGPERTWRRKIREALAATDLEANYSKHDILQTYLNNVYFGDGYYGVEAASRGYFGTSAANVNPVQSALLAGLIRSPAHSPRLQPARALARRNLVLRRMRDVDALDAVAYREALAAPMLIRARRDAALGRLVHGVSDDATLECGLYFYEEVRRQLVTLFGWERVRRGGLRVFTTIDPALQREAEQAIRNRLAEVERMRGSAARRARGGGPVQGALVSIDPRSGEVVALVGGRDGHASRYNRATEARRQPGSAFKPIIYAAALEQGFGPGSLLQELETPIASGTEFWLPAGEHEQAQYTLRSALKVSSNRASAQLLQRVGMSSALHYAERLGIASDLPAVPSLALGTGGVTLLELTSAYGAFANQGMWNAPMLIRRVEDRDGEVLWRAPISARQAVRPSTAYLMTSMLSDVVTGGTGYIVRGMLNRPSAGKTGTTDDYADAWFVGYTTRLVTGVWVGLDRPAPIMRRGFGGIVAAPAWARFMNAATKNDPIEWYEQPRDVERVVLCLRTGARAIDACREPALPRVIPFLADDVTAADAVPIVHEPSGVYEDIFAIGTGPYEFCPVHSASAIAPTSLIQATYNPIP
ncbi:MAG: transglycosylase domain-containing protein [Vicinamibacterales bacterium]